jgi:hypothetical protein
VKAIVVALVSALVLLSAGWTAASARPTDIGWVRYTVSPGASIELPFTWRKGKGTAHAVFAAFVPPPISQSLSPTQQGYDGVQVSVTRTVETSIDRAAARWVPVVRLNRLADYPKARFTKQRVHLPAGPAELVTTTTVEDKTRTPAILNEYLLIHRGHYYVFLFDCYRRNYSQFSGVIAHAVNSIRFSTK